MCACARSTRAPAISKILIAPRAGLKHLQNPNTAVPHLYRTGAFAMTAPIDFCSIFFAYGYFASTRIDDIAQKYGRGVIWHPILLGVVFKTTGSSPLPSIPLKGDYCWRDFERTAQFHHIGLQAPHAFSAAHAARRARVRGCRTITVPMATAFAKAVYRALFVDDINIAEPAELAKLAEPLGVDRSR
jgi:2-hydroxychromene-2-carboxylate isomerase